MSNLKTTEFHYWTQPMSLILLLLFSVNLAHYKIVLNYFESKN